MIRHDDIVIDRKERTIAIGDRFYAFDRRDVSSYHKGSIMFDTFSYMILKRHASRQELFAYIYGDNKEGGPLAGPKIFDIQICNWKHVFAALGLKLIREKKNGVQYLSFRKI